MKHSIGIDFGTTKTMVSYLNPDTNRVDLFQWENELPYIPTTVWATEKGEYLFGDAANEGLECDPNGYASAFKPELGSDDVALRRTGENAESLTKRFLAYVKRKCENDIPAFGGEIEAATLTYPVSFQIDQQQALERAAKAAGFEQVSFVREPEAAGIAFSRDNPSAVMSHAVVLDWGGGTLDVSILARGEDGSFRADRRCFAGDMDVGGEEMDRLLFQDISERWKTQFQSNLKSDDLKVLRHKREARKVKEKLSSVQCYPFRSTTRSVEISRDRFQELIQPLLDKAVELVEATIAKNASRGNPQPDAMLLIGGTCRIPAIRETMKRNFPNLRILSWDNGRNAVALGATALPKPETAKASPPEEKTDSSLTSETSFQVDLRGSASKKNTDAPFKLTDEVLALAEKVAVCDRPVCAEERRFIESALQENGVTDPDLVWNTWGTKPEWQLPSAGELAAAAAASLGSKKDNLLKCHRWLVSLAACDGPMTPEETSVIETIAIAFMFSKDTNKGSRPNAKNPEDSTRLEKVPTLANHGMIVGGIIGSFFGPGIGTVAGAAIGRWIGGKMYNY